MLEITGSIGWSTFLHSLVQGGIAGIVGNSAVAIAFHPLVIGVGVVIGVCCYYVSRWWRAIDKPSSSPIYVCIDIASRRV
ncbi:MAG: hypothetical protein F6J89_01990 [Symploca sp. SIO1C4]|uniref:Uncharacterized protein n=1 Tax=Symploca sp. SIO1C4 TaxID=2607765 RepID=A0A6B3N9X0_9CYAN|nr:hypothetical protein [Symploca sp. SIO1C4]